MTINFRGLDVAYFDILEMDGKRYVLDSNSTTSKRYYWGLSPQEFEIDLIKVEDDNKNFDKKIKTSPSWMRMVGIGIGLLFYRISTSIFRYYNISQYSQIKLLLFLLSFVVSYLIFHWIWLKSRKEISKRLPSNNKEYKIVFQNLKKKRQFHSYLFIILHCITLFFYMDLKNGTEASLLVLNGILAYLFIWIESGVIPLTYAYQQKYVIFKELKKV